ncbi:MAG TPA: hypothetical protein VFN35_15600, partial [Ktedonobacteraceae bacterium]|nr:hypothetical protein [Ktedonobacteraceae bacterium]
ASFFMTLSLLRMGFECHLRPSWGDLSPGWLNFLIRVARRGNYRSTKVAESFFLINEKGE